MRKIVWFLPALVIPLTLQIVFSKQPSSTATVNIPGQPLLPLSQLPQIAPVAPKANATQPPASAKKQPQQVIVQKHPPKAKTKSSKSKATIHPYTAPAIEIRVAIASTRSQSFAQNISNIAISSSTEANVIDSNGQVLEQLPPSEAFQVSASNSSILFTDWQSSSPVWIEPTDGGAVFIGNNWYRQGQITVSRPG